MAGSLSSLFRPPLDTRAYAAGSPSRRERSNPRPSRSRLNRRKEVRDGASSVGLSRRLDLIPLVDLEGPAASDRPLHRLLRRGLGRRSRARGGTFRLDPAESRDEEGAGELRCPPIRVQVGLTLGAAAQMSLDLCARARAERRLEVLPEKRDRVPTGHRLAAAVMVLSLLRCLLDTQHRCRDSACPMWEGEPYDEHRAGTSLARIRDGGGRARPVHGLRRLLCSPPLPSGVADGPRSRRPFPAPCRHGARDGPDSDRAHLLAVGPAVRASLRPGGHAALLPTR